MLEVTEALTPLREVLFDEIHAKMRRLPRANDAPVVFCKPVTICGQILYMS